MVNFFVRQAAAFKNDLNRSVAALIGIAQGMLCDGRLNDQEIHFLNAWLEANENIAVTWPGDALHLRIKEILADGHVSEEERAHLVNTLQQIVGGTLDDLANTPQICELGIDRDAVVKVSEATFCLTGEFVFAPRSLCEETITKRGGTISNSITKKVTYLVIGGLGSQEWKNGSFGGKIQKAMEYRKKGVPIFIVHEDQWASAL
ncbi:MAG: NAD-dependent DNA ligase [Rubrivivax sp.]|nr:MAG: NAD-dependent DNA ligase [Rubrivivax sp.]